MEKAAGQMLSTHAECFEGRFFGGVNDAPVRSCSFAGCRSPELDRVGCQANLRGWVPVSWFVDQRFIADINQHRIVLEVKPRQKTWRLRPWPIVPG